MLEADATGITEYVPLPDGTRCAFPEAPSGTARCYLKDQLNTVTVIDGQGQVKSKNSFYPYGQRIPLGENEFAKFGFNGKRKEDKGDLIYYGARYYDPVTRQFISPDPLRSIGVEDVFDGNSLQPYTYAASNPTTFEDENGEAVVGPVVRVLARVGIRLFSRAGGAAARVAMRAGPVAIVGGRLRRGFTDATRAAVQGWKCASPWMKAWLATQAYDAFTEQVLPFTRYANVGADAVADAVGALFAEDSDNVRGAAGGKRAGKRHTPAARRKAREESGPNCPRCGVRMKEPTRRTRGSKVDPAEAQGDHIIPRSKGGDGATVKDQRNIEVICSKCNLEKSDRVDE